MRLLFLTGCGLDPRRICPRAAAPLACCCWDVSTPAAWAAWRGPAEARAQGCWRGALKNRGRFQQATVAVLGKHVSVPCVRQTNKPWLLLGWIFRLQLLGKSSRVFHNFPLNHQQVKNFLQGGRCSSQEILEDCGLGPDRGVSAALRLRAVRAPAAPRAQRCAGGLAAAGAAAPRARH